MPIRIRQDKDQGNYSPRSGGVGGGGGGFGNLLPVLIGLFARNPKMLLVLAVVGGILYFAGGKGCGTLPAEVNSASEMFSLGASFDEKKYASTEIFEPLSNNKTHPLPEAVSLAGFAPKRLNQGQQGSCVAWASAYAARSIMEARASGKDPDEVTFSPSFLYNQIALENCQGSYLQEALKVMETKGLAPFSDMPYNDRDCSEKPNSFQLKKAEEFRIDGFNRLTGGRNGEDTRKVDMLAIKQNIANGAPVVIGMMVGGSFMQAMIGQDTWQSTDNDRNMQGFGGHAMCVIGYDDYKFARNMGGFQIMNSWGNEWGKNGIAWISYDDFEFFVKEAYGIYPMGNASEPASSALNVSVGIVMNRDGKNMAVERGANGSFRTIRPMAKQEDFKLEIINNHPCYIYVFGKESDNSTYVLFPYTAKHSPYCGITGRRLFPRDFSLYADDEGSLDEFAIVVSNKAIDYDAFNSRLSADQSKDLQSRLNALCSNTAVKSDDKNGNLNFVQTLSGDFLTGFIIQVSK